MGAALVLEADGIRMDYALAYDKAALSAGQRKALTASADPNRILATIPADLAVCRYRPTTAQRL